MLGHTGRLSQGPGMFQWLLPQVHPRLRKALPTYSTERTRQALEGKLTGAKCRTVGTVRGLGCCSDHARKSQKNFSLADPAWIMDVTISQYGRRGGGCLMCLINPRSEDLGVSTMWTWTKNRQEEDAQMENWVLLNKAVRNTGHANGSPGLSSPVFSASLHICPS